MVVAVVVTIPIRTAMTPAPIVIIVVTMTRANVDATRSDIYANVGTRRSGQRHSRHAREG